MPFEKCVTTPLRDLAYYYVSFFVFALHFSIPTMQTRMAIFTSTLSKSWHKVNSQRNNSFITLRIVIMGKKLKLEVLHPQLQDRTSFVPSFSNYLIQGIINNVRIRFFMIMRQRSALSAVASAGRFLSSPCKKYHTIKFKDRCSYNKALKDRRHTVCHCSFQIHP